MIANAGPTALPPPRSRGFTLVEVMVSLFVISIGLLGLAKIQALAYASTSTASMRSLVALQAAGLAASMHANREYWGLGLQPATITITGAPSGATVAPSLNAGAATANFCNFGQSAPCTPTQLAAYDVYTWSTALNNMLGNSNWSAIINCAIGTTPVNCQVTITWNENAVSVNSQSASNTTNATFNPTYILYVEP
jgi:type IV pilus assembly protein PilV